MGCGFAILLLTSKRSVRRRPLVAEHRQFPFFSAKFDEQQFLTTGNFEVAVLCACARQGRFGPTSELILRSGPFSFSRYRRALLLPLGNKFTSSSSAIEAIAIVSRARRGDSARGRLRLSQDSSQSPILLVGEPKPDTTPSYLNGEVERVPRCLIASSIAAQGCLSDTGRVSESQSLRKASPTLPEAAMPSETAGELQVDEMFSNALFALLCPWCVRLRQRNPTGRADSAVLYIPPHDEWIRS